ncbi:MAG: Rrf2 family transcriptional regulator [Ruminiclostridium sp.]|nr:Rrf2 family transcriptional regulator [Ruminiclostridium sp.]
MHISTKCSIAIHCLIFIYEYGEEKRITSELLSLSTGCNPVTVRNIMSALKKDNIISVKFGSGGAKICCPLDKISLYRICKAVEPDMLNKLIGIHSAPSPLCPIGRNIHAVLDKSYEKIRIDLVESLNAITMKEIIDNYRYKEAE